MNVIYSRTSHALISFSFPKVIIVRATCVPVIKYFSTAETSQKNPFNFNEKEIHQILDLINTKSAVQLTSYDISKAKINKLESWKLKNGNFQQLDDILYLDGFSVKIVEKFFKSLLGVVPVKRPPRKAAAFVIPSMPETQIEEINSCVSIGVGVSSVIWSRLELNKYGPCKLTHWERHDIQEKKLHLHDLIHRCMYVSYSIPQADCYVFESPQTAQISTPGNAEQININVQRAQLTAILGFALANRNTSPERSISNIFYLKRFLAARLFQHLVGTERISAESTVLSLMRTHYNIDDIPDTECEADVGEESLSGRGSVCFPSELRAIYKQADGYQREFLGQTLLLNLAFVRLVLLRDGKAIALVSRNSRASEEN